MEGAADETYNFKSSSQISTNFNSRPRSTYMSQKKVGRLIKTQQSRSVSPNTFQPLYIEEKIGNTKTAYLLKKNQPYQQLIDVNETNQSFELRQSSGSLKDKHKQNIRPKSTNQLARITQSAAQDYDLNYPKQNNLIGNELNSSSKEAISTNNTYYNQFYNVSKILNSTENNLDASALLEVTYNSVKNAQLFNKTSGSMLKNNYSNNLTSDSNDISLFNSNQKSQNKSKILQENAQNTNRELRSLSRIGSRNATNNKQNRRILSSNSKGVNYKSANNINLQEDSKIYDTSQAGNNEEDLDENTDKNEYSKEIKDEKENKQSPEHSKSRVKMEVMDEKEVKNISFYINNMMYEDFKVYTDAQLLSKMDKESLIIRLQLLEQENKEIKCHNLHLSSKFKEMLNEYTRYKEYQDNIDRKSLYQKHVQKLAELSKTCHDQAETIQQKNSKIQQLEEIIVRKDNEIKQLKEEIANYDAEKDREILEVDNRYKQQILDFIERVDYLNKENRKIPLLEKTAKDLQDKIQEDKNKYLSALEKSEERYKMLSGKQTDKDREIWSLKEKMKEQEISFKLQQEQNQAILIDRCNDYEKKLTKLEIEQHSVNLSHQKQEKQLLSEIQSLQEQMNNLRQQMLDNQQKALEREQSLGNVISSQNEQYQTYRNETISQIADIIEKTQKLEDTLDEKRQIIEKKQKDLQQKSERIIELQKKLESASAAKEKMKEEHEKELNKIFKTKQEETSSLTFKIKELKLYYEVEIENLRKDCDDRIKEHSQSATDAKRQYVAMKNNFNNEVEGKESEIEFLKNKIYEEKQKIKEQIDTQYKDMIKDMQKRIMFLQNELDDQKIEIENTICEDLAVYNRQSKYWKKSRDIRDEKFSIKSINSEESSKKEATPLKKRNTIFQKHPNLLNPQDVLKIKFQTVAKCAAAFEEQQDKIDKLRSQIDTLQKRISNLIKQQYMAGGNKGGQNHMNLSDILTRNTQLSKQTPNENERDQGLDSLQDERDFYLNENELNELNLAKQVKELRDQLYQQRLKNSEMQESFIQKEYELNESHKLEKKNLQKQFDNTNQVKIQQVFEKDILLEKQVTKITDLQRLLDESTQLLKSQTEFTEKMKTQFKELNERNEKIVGNIKKENEELLSMWDERESLSKDIREIERLNTVVNKLNNEIKQLKLNQSNKNGNVTQGLVFESQLRTSYDLQAVGTQKSQQHIEQYGNNNNAYNNNQLNFTKSDIISFENKNKSLENDQHIKQNLNKSIHIPQNSSGVNNNKRDFSRPRTKTSFKLDKESDSSSINVNKYS